MTDKKVSDSKNIISSIFSKIGEARSIAVFSHIRPDGDTLGSALAFKNHICGIKNCEIFCDDELPPKYSFLKGFDCVRRDKPENFDLIISFDCSDIRRMGVYAETFKKSKNTINVDHHISNENFAGINYVAEASSTCELLYNMLKITKSAVSKETAECLYCGISSDTGNFSHSNTNFKTFEAAAALSKIIGDISYINQKIYKEMALCKLRLTASVLNGIKMFFNDKMAVLSVFTDDLKKYECPAYETEGLVDYAVNLYGVDVGVILLESGVNCFKVSLRSKNADVCKIAAEFGGGGHIHASGCMIFGTYGEVMEKLVKNAEFYIG